jgi:hypothetical protein
MLDADPNRNPNLNLGPNLNLDPMPNPNPNPNPNSPTLTLTLTITPNPNSNLTSPPPRAACAPLQDHTLSGDQAGSGGCWEHCANQRTVRVFRQNFALADIGSGV